MAEHILTHRYIFQINTRYGVKLMSAFGSLGLVIAPSLTVLLRKIMKAFDLRIEQIILEFQPRGTDEAF